MIDEVEQFAAFCIEIIIEFCVSFLMTLQFRYAVLTQLSQNIHFNNKMMKNIKFT